MTSWTSSLLGLAVAMAGFQMVAATFQSDAVIDAGDLTYEGEGIVVSGCTLTVNGPHAFASLAVRDRGTVCHTPAGAGRESAHRVDLTIGGDVTIEAGSAIRVDGLGYAGDTGPGAGAVTTATWWWGGGGGHGGRGGDSSGSAGGQACGSATEPTLWGSGGGRGANPNIPGNPGGGAVRLRVGGRLTLEGEISARGGDTAGEAHLGGGGAGGSIWIAADRLEGSGRVNADGGHSGVDYGVGGGGGGGRIAIVSRVLNLTGAISAFGGRGYPGWAGAGTVYARVNGEPGGTLRIDNGGHAGATTPLGSIPLLDLRVEAGARLEPMTRLYLGRLIIGAGGSIDGDRGDPPPAPPAIWISCGEELTLESGAAIRGNCFLTVAGRLSLAGGARIDASEMGFPSWSGPGAGSFGYGFGLPSGTGAYVGAGGGGHGSSGQDGGDYAGQNPKGGPAYGSDTEPIDWGSGGGYGDGRWPDTAGAGGGAVRILVGDVATVDGLISVDGGSPRPNTPGGGGGAGGSLWMTARRLAGTGVLSAIGKAGSPPGAVWGGSHEGAGAGAGGRVALYTSDASSFAGRILVESPAPEHAGTLRLGPIPTSARQVVSVIPGVTVAETATFDLLFSDPNVRIGSVTSADFVITTAGGDVPVDAVQVSLVGPGRFQVRFPVAPGVRAYRALIGPGFEDMFGGEVEMTLGRERWLGLGLGPEGPFLTWVANGPSTYRLQVADDLGQSLWSDSGEPVEGGGRCVLEALSSPIPARAFYRLRVGP